MDHENGRLKEKKKKEETECKQNREGGRGRGEALLKTQIMSSKVYDIVQISKSALSLSRYTGLENRNTKVPFLVKPLGVTCMR